MSNLQKISASSVDLKELKSRYLDLISNGYTENVALQTLNFPKALYLRLMVEDYDFITEIENARKARADFWVGKIIDTIDQDVAKDEVGSERLRFDKLQFLARADNPDRYGNNSKSKVDVNIDLGQFKLLPPDEALKALSNDPFAPKIIEAEIVIKEPSTFQDLITDDEQELL